MSKRIDLNGRVFGNITVLEFSHVSKSHAYWKVQCKCGRVYATQGSNLRSGNSKGCFDCHVKNITGKPNKYAGNRPSTRRDLAGKKFGEYTVIDFNSSKKRPSGGVIALWNAKCSCGVTKILPAQALTGGTSKRCNECRIIKLATRGTRE